MAEVTECRMRRTNPTASSFVFTSSTLDNNIITTRDIGALQRLKQPHPPDGDGVMTPSSASSSLGSTAAAAPNKSPALENACPISRRGKANNIILLFAITLAIFPTFYAVGMILGSAIGAYTQWDGDLSSISMPSTITLRKQTTPSSIGDDGKFNIDTVGMSINELDLLKSLASSAILRGRVLDMIVEEFISPMTPDNDNESKRESAIEALQFTETDNEPVPIEDYPFLFVGSVGTRFVSTLRIYTALDALIL